MSSKKRAQLSEYGRKSYVSAAAMSSLLKEVKEMGLPETLSRSSITRARGAELRGKKNTARADLSHQESTDGIRHYAKYILCRPIRVYAYMYAQISRLQKAGD